MAYTSHGHHIPGTLQGSGTVGEVIKCGGVEVCPRCKSEIENTMAIRTAKVNFVGEVPVVNRLDGHPEEGQVVGTAKLEKLNGGNIIAHIDGSTMTGEMLRRGFSMGSFSIAEE